MLRVTLTLESDTGDLRAAEDIEAPVDGPNAQVPQPLGWGERNNADMSDKVTAPMIKARKGADPVKMITAYDFPTARIADRAGAEIILVGDSLANAVLGYADTLSVTVDDMVHHTAAVASGRTVRVNRRRHAMAELPHLYRGDRSKRRQVLFRRGTPRL